MRPSGTTPPAPPPSSSTSLYPPIFPSNNPSINNDSSHLHHPHHHHQYGAFSPGFTAAAVACSSSGYPTFFPSKFNWFLYPQGNIFFQLQHVVTMGLVHLAHLIIVAQLIQQVFKIISLPVGENKSFNSHIDIYVT